MYNRDVHGRKGLPHKTRKIYEHDEGDTENGREERMMSKQVSVKVKNSTLIV